MGIEAGNQYGDEKGEGEDDDDDDDVGGIITDVGLDRRKIQQQNDDSHWEE